MRTLTVTQVLAGGRTRSPRPAAHATGAAGARAERYHAADLITAIGSPAAIASPSLIGSSR